MKMHMKSGETLRICSDGGQNFIFYIENGLMQATVQPAGQPTRIIVVSKDAIIERENAPASA